MRSCWKPASVEIRLFMLPAERTYASMCSRESSPDSEPKMVRMAASIVARASALHMNRLRMDSSVFVSHSGSFLWFQGSAISSPFAQASIIQIANWIWMSFHGAIHGMVPM